MGHWLQSAENTSAEHTSLWMEENPSATYSHQPWFPPPSRDILHLCVDRHHGHWHRRYHCDTHEAWESYSHCFYSFLCPQSPHLLGMEMTITVDNSQDFWTKIQRRRGLLILTGTFSSLLRGWTVSHHNYVRVLCPFFDPEAMPMPCVHSAAGEVPSHL